MKIYLWIMFVFGALEIATNLFHLTKGSIARIASSAKRQHGELPKDLGNGHYVAKALVMFLFGVAFLVCAWLSLGLGISALALAVPTAAFALHGLIQAFMYPRYRNVWFSAVVYIMPLAALMLLLP